MSLGGLAAPGACTGWGDGCGGREEVEEAITVPLRRETFTVEEEEAENVVGATTVAVVG